MRDLRPRIAADITGDLLALVGSEITDDLLDKMIEVVQGHLESKAIPYPPGSSWISTEDPIVVKEFMAKYPETTGMVVEARERIAAVFPDAVFTLSVFTDPEIDGICFECQNLTLTVDIGADDAASERLWDIICLDGFPSNDVFHVTTF